MPVARDRALCGWTGLPAFADLSAEAARWFGLIGVGASACAVWLLLLLGAHLAGRDRWKRPLLWTLPVVAGFTVVAMIGLLLSGSDP